MSAPLVFITGASSGIGQALAARYARAGWRLALVARRTEVLEAWVRAQGLASERVGVYGADVAIVDSIVAAGQACIERQGLPDVVIANAGISVGMDTADRADLDVMREVFAINNVGLAATFHPFLRPMRERGSGALVGIASVGAIRGMPGHGAYGASKAAVVAYCESLRGDCRGSGVRVVTLLPGFVATPLTAQNDFEMPALISAADAAARIVKGFASGAFEIHFPRRFTRVLKLLGILPDRLYFRLIARSTGL